MSYNRSGETSLPEGTVIQQQTTKVTSISIPEQQQQQMYQQPSGGAIVYNDNLASGSSNWATSSAASSSSSSSIPMEPQLAPVMPGQPQLQSAPVFAGVGTGGIGLKNEPLIPVENYSAQQNASNNSGGILGHNTLISPRSGLGVSTMSGLGGLDGVSRYGGVSVGVPSRGFGDIYREPVNPAIIAEQERERELAEREKHKSKAEKQAEKEQEKLEKEHQKELERQQKEAERLENERIKEEQRLQKEAEKERERQEKAARKLEEERIAAEERLQKEHSKELNRRQEAAEKLDERAQNIPAVPASSSYGSCSYGSSGYPVASYGAMPSEVHTVQVPAVPVGTDSQNNVVYEQVAPGTDLSSNMNNLNINDRRTY